MPDESIDCLITSPPYWGLRNYGLEPIVWDAADGCEHDFNEYDAKLLHENRQGLSGSTLGNADFRKKLHGFGNAKAGFCIHCNAWKGSLGLEKTFQLYIAHLMQIFGEVYRVLKKTGTCWVVIADTFASSGGASRHYGYQDPKYPNGRDGNFEEPAAYEQQGALPKSLCQIPSRFAIAMTDAGWILRNEIIWKKNNCMPSSAKDRFTVDFEKIYFFSKQGKYWFKQQFEASLDPEGDVRRLMKAKDYSANRQGGNAAFQQKNRDEGATRNRMLQGRNKRCVWNINTKPFKGAHFAVFPPDLVEPMILAGCPEHGICLDPFMGSGTVAKVALRANRQFIGFEPNQEYVDMGNKRIESELIQMKMDI